METNHNKMDRRTSLKVMGAASLAGLVWTTGCDTKETADTQEHVHNTDDTLKLSEADKKLMEQQFFTDHEMETVRILSDMTIPADDRSGGASDAGVPEFIEFMMKDQPWHQTGMRGGLNWLDAQCRKQFGNNFADCNEDQRKVILNEIAYPEGAKPEMSQGVNFFNNFRNFVATGFFTSKIGIEDLQYMGNRPTVWQGSPPEVLDRLGVSYDMVKEYKFV